MAKKTDKTGGRLALQMTYLPNDTSEAASVTHMILEMNEAGHGIFTETNPIYNKKYSSTLSIPVSTDVKVTIKGMAFADGKPYQTILKQHVEPVKPNHAVCILGHYTGEPICDTPMRQQPASPLTLLRSDQVVCGDCKDVFQDQWRDVL